MPTADSNVFSITVGTTAPAWTVGKNSREWYQPFAGTMFDVHPTPYSLSDSNSGPDAASFHTLMVWSSGFFNQVLKYFGSFGGGHAAMNDNSFYGIAANDAAPIMRRFNNPTPNGQMVRGALNSDGRPTQGHTGDYVVCDNLGRVILMGLGRTWGGQGGGFPNIMRYTWETDTWTQVGTLSTTYAPIAGSELFYTAVAIDSLTGIIYAVNQSGRVCSFNPATNAYADIFSPGGVGWPDTPGDWDRSATIWTAPSGVKVLLVLRSETNRLYAMNLASPASGWTAMTPSGSPSFATQGAGFEWHTASNGALAWSNSTNRQLIRKLNPPTTTPSTYAQAVAAGWNWTTVAPLSGSIIPSNPWSIGRGEGASPGTYKRFGILLNVTSTQDMIGLLNDVNQQAYVMLIPKTGI